MRPGCILGNTKNLICMYASWVVSLGIIIAWLFPTIKSEAQYCLLYKTILASWSMYSEKFVYLYCNIPLFPFVCTIIENITLIPNFTENGTPLGGTSRARHTYGICIPFPVKMGTVLTSLFPLSDTPGIYRCMFSNCFKHKINNVGVSVLEIW